MRKNEIIIKQALENVFNKLTVDASTFIDLYGFKTAEIKVRGLLRTIGIGLYAPSPSIKIFFIDDQLAPDDHLRFKPIMKVSHRYWGEQAVVWDIEFADETQLVVEVGDLQKFSAYMQAAHYIIQDIEYEERELLSKI